MRWLSIMQALDLLSLSEDILQGIAWHFTLKEWVKGPAHTCRLLHTMELKRVDLQYRKFLEVYHSPPFQCVLLSVSLLEGIFLQLIPNDLLSSADSFYYALLEQ